MYTLTQKEIYIAEKVIRTLYHMDYEELPFEHILDMLEDVETNLEGYNYRAKLQEYAEKISYSKSEKERNEAQREHDELIARLEAEGMDL